VSRVVVVTGASQGVGRAAARAFAERGDRIALIARDDDGLAAAAAEARRRAPGALAAPADLADAGAVEAAAARVEDELGPIDVWVNAAMVSVFSPVAELRPDEVRRVTEVTYLGAVNGTLAALSRMRARGRGRIVQVGSALAYRAIPLQAAYCGAKFALRGFTDSLRTELLREGSRITVTSVHLPAINTPQFEVVRTRLPRHPRPVPPIYQPEVAAAAILHAADHGGRERWIGRATIATILGERVAPALLDRYLARTGIDAQQTDEPVPAGRPDNLEHPLPGDRGAHGRFGDAAATVSLSAWAREHLDVIGAGAALLTAAGWLARGK
jgi:NAD(P)-dependent dehydrogenase (short-subunit alcohol dehydrogenase family)